MLRIHVPIVYATILVAAATPEVSSGQTAPADQRRAGSAHDRVEHDVCRPISPRLPQREAHLAVGRQGEPLGRDGRPERVPADPFEPIALSRRNDERRMQVQSLPPRMTRTQWAIDRRSRVSETTNASAGATPEGDEPLHRCGRQARERWRLVHPGIHPAILGVASMITLGAFSAIEQPPDGGSTAAKIGRKVDNGPTRPGLVEPRPFKALRAAAAPRRSDTPVPSAPCRSATDSGSRSTSCTRRR
jgi:hypothetical protein